MQGLVCRVHSFLETGRKEVSCRVEVVVLGIWSWGFERGVETFLKNWMVCSFIHTSTDFLLVSTVGQDSLLIGCGGRENL